ncbi:HAMP domain-containing sensor histidine kinase [Zestomonas carbonaria]|uniref:histidine kinase n=1 Tax=Zestomonas carbonaria TaxID=2762745 RepID=A0A7U7I7P2_9GAMM|nr:sensor histidine kinase [Pseudomonas carbonaria]CAD5106405.1 Sensor protein PfeS [Pseudomonas carbonaria]
MNLPGRHSLFWKLAVLLVAFCVLVIWLTRSWSIYAETRSYHLSSEAKRTLIGYSREAEQAWLDGGTEGVDRWLQEMSLREPSWMTVVGKELQPLGSRPLSPEEVGNLTFMRQVDWPMSKRSIGLPHISLPFPSHPESGQLVIQLPERYLPKGLAITTRLAIQVLMPALLALLLGVLLYRLLISPLSHLREQANALRGDRLATRVAPRVATRRDELGELGRAFDHMAGRLENTVAFQRQLLRDLSHELRTPLSRLRVAGEHEQDIHALRQRLEREVEGMERLIGDTLELVWLDTERPRLPLDAVEVPQLWEVLRENACFETGWPAERLPCELPADCRVTGHLNGLAQALENILRNAIRHSPEDGVVRLSGRRDGEHWHLWVEDQGPGVADDALDNIFQPFTRLNAARPGGDGFGLGLSIARSMVRLQGGELWAENRTPGLRLNLRLQSV